MTHLAEVRHGFSFFKSCVVVNPFIDWRNFKLKGRAEKERAYGNHSIRKARLDIIKNGPNFAVVIIKKLRLVKTSGFDW